LLQRIALIIYFVGSDLPSCSLTKPISLTMEAALSMTIIDMEHFL